MKCMHEETKTIHTAGFFAAVSREENRAAHGGVCDTEECVACGARRAANVNGCHVELGAWGPSRADRAAEARRAEMEARRAVDRIPTLDVTRGDGLRLSVTVDAEGCIYGSGDPHTEADLRAAVGSQHTWLGSAKRAREAVIAASHAQAAV